LDITLSLELRHVARVYVMGCSRDYLRVRLVCKPSTQTLGRLGAMEGGEMVKTISWREWRGHGKR
jgi:hypothetical protein